MCDTRSASFSYGLAAQRSPAFARHTADGSMQLSMAVSKGVYAVGEDRVASLGASQCDDLQHLTLRQCCMQGVLWRLTAAHRRMSSKWSLSQRPMARKRHAFRCTGASKWLRRLHRAALNLLTGGNNFIKFLWGSCRIHPGFTDRGRCQKSGR